MSIFELIKRRSKSSQTVIQLTGAGGIAPSFYAGEDLRTNEAVAACIATNATFCSKVEFSSVRIKKNGATEHDWKSLDKLLQIEPNPLQCAAVFWERVRSLYDAYNNAFIYIERSTQNEPIALWAIDPSAVRFKRISTGELVLIFTLLGREQVHDASEIAHIARNVTGDQMFGLQTNASIRRIVEMIDLNYKGIENGILNSSLIRYLGEMTTKLTERQLKKKADEFTKTFLRVPKNSRESAAIAITDSSMKVTPVPAQKQEHANYLEASAWEAAIYKHFGCPEQVIKGTATEEEMTAYYERTIEPFFTRVAQELTRKIFTDREYETGNRIVFNDRKLQYMTTKTRLALFTAAREIGAFTLGTLGDLLGLPVPEENRGVIVTSQNYIESKKTKEEEKNE